MAPLSETVSTIPASSPKSLRKMEIFENSTCVATMMTMIILRKGTKNMIISTCTCRGIPIVPSWRMLETLLMDEDSLFLTWFILSVIQIFNAVLFTSWIFFSSDFFSASDYFHSFFSIHLNCCTFLDSLVSLESLFHDSAALTLKLFFLTSVLAYLWTRFSGSAACLVLAPVILTVSSHPLAYPSFLLHMIQSPRYQAYIRYFHSVP